MRAWNEKIIRQILADDEQRNKFFEGLRRQFKQDPERFDYDTYSVYIGATRLERCDNLRHADYCPTAETVTFVAR